MIIMKTEKNRFLNAVVLCCVIVCFLLGVNERAFCAGRGEGPGRVEIGVMGGLGTGSISEGRYEPLMLMLHLGYTIKTFEHKNGGAPARLSLILEPQYNNVLKPDRDYEFGLGIGIKYMHPLTNDLHPYIYACTGPHYISVNSENQAEGFVFSNQFGVGLYYFATKRTALNAGYRFRHMSNGGTRDPNSGIDSHLGVIGLSVFF